MPTYEYACMDCGTHVEVFQHFSDDPLTTCGTCGGRLRKVFHPAGILFKGSGFYKTDSRSSSSKSSGGESKSSTSSSSSSGSDSGKSDGKKTDSSSSSSSSKDSPTSTGSGSSAAAG